MTMPADPPRPAHDEVVERLWRLSIALHNHTPASALRAAYPGLAPAERDWSCRDDLHDVLARLAQAERRAEEAERLAGERLEALVEALDLLPEPIGMREEAQMLVGGQRARVMAEAADIDRLRALTAAAEGTGRADAR